MQATRDATGTQTARCVKHFACVKHKFAGEGVPFAHVKALCVENAPPAPYSMGVSPNTGKLLDGARPRTTMWRSRLVLALACGTHVHKTTHTHTRMHAHAHERAHTFIRLI